MFVVDPDAQYMEDTRQIAEYLPEPMRTRLARTAPSHILSNSTGDRWVMGRIKRPEVNYPNAYSEPDGDVLLAGARQLQHAVGQLHGDVHAQELHDARDLL